MSKLGYPSALLFLSVKPSTFSFLPTHKKQKSHLLPHWLNLFSFNGGPNVLLQAAAGLLAVVTAFFGLSLHERKTLPECLQQGESHGQRAHMGITLDTILLPPFVCAWRYFGVMCSFCWFILLGDKQECFFQREVTQKTVLFSFPKYL